MTASTLNDGFSVWAKALEALRSKTGYYRPAETETDADVPRWLRLPAETPHSRIGAYPVTTTTSAVEAGLSSLVVQLPDYLAEFEREASDPECPRVSDQLVVRAKSVAAVLWPYAGHHGLRMAIYRSATDEVSVAVAEVSRGKRVTVVLSEGISEAIVYFTDARAREGEGKYVEMDPRDVGPFEASWPAFEDE